MGHKSRCRQGGRPEQRVLDRALAVKQEAEAEAAKQLPIHGVEVMKLGRGKQTKRKVPKG